MANLEGMKCKYTVIKNEDVENMPYGDVWKMRIQNICDAVNICRAINNKKENTYIVINADEPYADEVIEILKRNKHWG